MKKMFLYAATCLWLAACNNEAKKDEGKTNETTTNADSGKSKSPQQSEFADARYADIGKKMGAQLKSGDVDGWVSNYADDAKYRWSAGDSLSGKAEIAKYWGDRRKNVIDSIDFLNEIWLPIKINTPQTKFDAPGVWLLSWYMVSVKYKNGKKLMFWTHTDHHFNANDKIDQTIQYIDRAPINKALGVK
jgi:hypothetical protein